MKMKGTEMQTNSAKHTTKRWSKRPASRGGAHHKCTHRVPQAPRTHGSNPNNTKI